MGLAGILCYTYTEGAAQQGQASHKAESLWGEGTGGPKYTVEVEDVHEPVEKRKME